MNQGKTRVFKLINKDKSGTTGRMFPNTEATIPKHIIVKDKVEQEIAWLSGRPSIYVNDWKGFEGSVMDNQSGLTFTKPVFTRGFLYVSPDESMLADFLAISPQNINSPYAGQKGIKPQFEEIIESDNAEEEARRIKMKSKMEGYIFDLDDSVLHSIAMLYGVRIVDHDNTTRSSAAIAIDVINSISSNPDETIEDFIENCTGTEFEAKTTIAEGFIKGIIEYDSITGRVNFKGGNPIYVVADKENYILDIYLWIKGTDDGKNMYNNLTKRLGIRQEDKSFEIVEKVNAAVAASGLQDLKGFQVLDEAKKHKIIKWDANDKCFKKVGGAGRTYPIKDDNGDFIKTKESLVELIDNDDELRKEIIEKTAAVKS